MQQFSGIKLKRYHARKTINCNTKQSIRINYIFQVSGAPHPGGDGWTRSLHHVRIGSNRRGCRRVSLVRSFVRSVVRSSCFQCSCCSVWCRIHMHPDYDMFTVDMDYSLLKLARPIDFAAHRRKIAPICWPTAPNVHDLLEYATVHTDAYIYLLL